MHVWHTMKRQLVMYRAAAGQYTAATDKYAISGAASAGCSWQPLQIKCIEYAADMHHSQTQAIVLEKCIAAVEHACPSCSSMTVSAQRSCMHV
jgi:hypothetical protein